jgi:predicted RNase H-like nuclease (RuvC/YqgF family)
MSEPPTKKNRLAEAAEALIEAASLETDSMTQKQLTANLDSLKSSFVDNLNRVVQKLQSSNENFDAKINTLNQHVHDLKIEMGALKKIMENQTKQKTLELALTLLDLNSFTYFECSNNYHANQKNSSELAKTVIRLFMLGYGYNLPLEATLTNEQRFTTSTAEKELLKKAFIDKFAGQIRALIKREPRLAKNENGANSIFYE